MRSCSARSGFLFLLPLFFASTSHAASLEELAQSAVSPDPAIHGPARQQLRDAGPAGLQALCDLLPSSVPMPAAAPDPIPALLTDAIDLVAAQRDAASSRLYWYTDLDQALAVAQAQDKPLLVLNLLGQLTDEFSCANSRFFRAALYPHAEVSKLLRDCYVLCWVKVADVPRLTIEFSDGRRLERTITGNSIHYVLDTDGTLLDAIPGLYAPQTFERTLESVLDLRAQRAALPAADRPAHLAQFHRTAADRAEQEFHAALTSLGRQDLVAAHQSDPGHAMDRIPEEVWSQLAERYAAEAHLDPASLALVQRALPPAWAAGRLAITKAKIESPLLRMAASLERSLAEDTVRNECALHPTLRRWLADLPAGNFRQLANFNQRVYAYLFLMPIDDPWMGLLATPDYTGLTAAGVHLAAPQTP
jgi:hypothetical protein